MTHQGLLGSFSTGALLVGAAIAILVVLGAVVAFNGFPGPSSDSSTETFTLEGEPANTGAAPDDEASFELIDPEPGPATAAPGVAPAAAAPALGAPGTGVSGDGSLLDASGPSRGSAPPTVRIDPSSGRDRNNGGGGDGDGLGDVVRNLTTTVDGTLHRLSPSTRSLSLRKTTEPLSGSLDKVGGTLGL